MHMKSLNRFVLVFRYHTYDHARLCTHTHTHTHTHAHTHAHTILRRCPGREGAATEDNRWWTGRMTIKGRPCRCTKYSDHQEIVLIFTLIQCTLFPRVKSSCIFRLYSHACLFPNTLKYGFTSKVFWKSIFYSDLILVFFLTCRKRLLHTHTR